MTIQFTTRPGLFESMQRINAVRCLLVTFLRTGAKRLRKVRIKRRSIGYVGGHFSGNLGDEAMFNAFCNSISHRNVETLETPRIEWLLEKFGLSGKKYFSDYVLGGGTLINPTWEGKVRKLLTQGVPFHAVGCGVGSSGREQGGQVEIRGWKSLLDEFETVGVRGPISAARLAEIGVEAEILGDLALLEYQPAPAPRCENLHIAINLLYDDVTYAKMSSLMEKLLSTCADNSITVEAWIVNAEDIKITETVSSGRHVSFFSIETIDDLRARASEVDFCVCTRLHAAVLGICVEVPSILLGYRDKCQDFALSVNMGEAYVDLSSEDYTDQMDRALKIMLDRHSRLALLDTSTSAVRAHAETIKSRLEQIFE